MNPDVGVPAWKSGPPPCGQLYRNDEHRRYCEALEDLFADLFLVHVPPERTFLYKVSVAVAKSLGFDPLGKRNITQTGHHEYRITGSSPAEGMYYPSIAHQAKGGNFAIRSESVERLELQDVEWLQIVSGSDGTARAKAVDFANAVSDVGAAGVERQSGPIPDDIPRPNCQAGVHG